jgi:hypothetical protein
MSAAKPETVSLAGGAGGTAKGVSRSIASRLRRSVGHARPTEGPDQGPKIGGILAGAAINDGLIYASVRPSAVLSGAFEFSIVLRH